MLLPCLQRRRAVAELSVLKAQLGHRRGGLGASLELELQPRGNEPQMVVLVTGTLPIPIHVLEYFLLLACSEHVSKSNILSFWSY